MNILHIGKEYLDEIVSTRRPLGKFYAKEGGVIACDNSTGDAWVEAFLDRSEAVEWLANGSRTGHKDCMGPCGANQKLFDFLRRTYGVTALDTEMGDIVGIVSKTGYAETEENCKGCEAKALLLACRAARIAYCRAGRGTPERASAIGRTVEAERAADKFLEHCKGAEDSESRKQSKSAILRGMFGYTDRGMGVTPRWEWTVQGGAEAYMKALEDRIRQLEFEREEVRKMRTVQKKFFRSPQGSAAKVAALEESRRLERWVDTALEPSKPTAATLFG